VFGISRPCLTQSFLCRKQEASEETLSVYQASTWALKSSNAHVLILAMQANLSRKDFPGDEKWNAEDRGF